MASTPRALGQRLFAMRAGLHGRHVPDHVLLDLMRGSAEGDGVSREATKAHVSACVSCADRLAQLTTFLDAITEESAAAFDDTVSTARLATERARIMRRVERAAGQGRAARILRFPVFARPALAAVGRVHRWIGAAAVAGVLTGIAIGQFVHLHADPEPLTARAEGPARVSTEAPTTASDEQFMQELELALTSPRVSALVALDEMTPLLREVSINVR